jgi:hypothetical protein
MSEPSAGITFKVMQEMMPPYNIPPDLIEDVVAAMPPPPPGASRAWRDARLARVIEDLGSRVPMNAAQASLAGQIVIVVALASDAAARAGAPELDTAERCRLLRTTDALMNTLTRLERTLERRQFRVMPFRDARPVETIDMEVLDGAWCRRGAAAEVAAAQAVVAAGVVATAGAGSISVTDAAPVVRDAAPVVTRARRVVRDARPGMPAAAQAEPWAEAQPETGRRLPTAREGVTVEHGDGWSLEVWRPGAGAAAMRAAMRAAFARKAGIGKVSPEGAVGEAAGAPGGRKA